MFTPAVQVRGDVNFASGLGRLLHLDGNLFIRKTPDLDESAKISPNGGIQIYELIQYIAKKHGDQIPQYRVNEAPHDQRLSYVHVYERINVPVFLAVAEVDPAVSTAEEKALYEQIKTSKTLAYFPKATGVWHGNILKSQWDAYKTKDGSLDYNYGFPELSAKVLIFLDSLIK